MGEKQDDESLRVARIRVRAARRTVLLFLVFGIVWVVATDYIAVHVLEDTGRWDDLQTLKGTVFVLLSSAIIYVSIVRYAERVLVAEADSRGRLTHSEREFQAMVETMGEGVCTLDLDNRLLYVNRQLSGILGRESAELLGTDISEILIDPDEAGTSGTMSRGDLRRLSGQRELCVKRKNGSEIPIWMNVVPRHDSEGREIGTLCVINDLTDAKRLEAERERLLVQVEQMTRIESLGKLAGTMAHEFNNVMAGVLPFTEVIERTSHGDERIMSATSYIREAVNRGRRVSQEVLRFARPVTPTRKGVDVAEIGARVERLGRSIMRGDHELEVEMKAGSETLEVDIEQIEQVFTNILINANDAMGSKGVVRIASTRDRPDANYPFGVVQRPDRFVHFSITDNGSGIPGSVLNRIFEPMVTTKRRGTGLGLAVTYQIVTSHGGQIFAESSEGSGTTFHLFLPISTEDS